MLFHPLGPGPSEVFRWLIITMVLAVVLGCGGFFAYVGIGHTDRDYRRKATIAELHKLSSALEAFYTDTGRYPTPAEGLHVLVTAPQDLPGWNGPYVDKVPLDEWGHPYHYSLAKDLQSVNLHSVGKDCIDGTADDLTKDSQ